MKDLTIIEAEYVDVEVLAQEAERPHVSFTLNPIGGLIFGAFILGVSELLRRESKNKTPETDRF